MIPIFDRLIEKMNQNILPFFKIQFNLMKRIKLFSAIIIIVGLFAGCKKEPAKSAPDNNQVVQTIPGDHKIIAFEEDLETLNARIKANEERLAALGMDASRECMETVVVPKDFPTIQEAVDHVCDYGNVIVQTGTYDENVMIYKPGLFLNAAGNVLVNGSFTLTPDADDVRIQNFNIDLTTSIDERGINAYNVDGGEAKNNTVFGNTGEYEYPARSTGIRYYGSSNVTVKNNHVSGMEWGITFSDNADDGLSSHNNTIKNNTVTGITYASGIHLQGDADNCLVIGNTVTDCDIVINAGILVFGVIGDKVSENNVIRENIVSNISYPGIWLYGGMYNTVGPENTANENLYGIYLSGAADGCEVSDNTALNNTACDILDLSTGTNTFINNTADCIDVD
jgi:parallel beta-helix repeat protein